MHRYAFPAVLEYGYGYTGDTIEVIFKNKITIFGKLHAPRRARTRRTRECMCPRRCGDIIIAQKIRDLLEIPPVPLEEPGKTDG